MLNKLKILIYDDDVYKSSGDLFITELSTELREYNVDVDLGLSVDIFEDFAKNNLYSIFILDIKGPHNSRMRKVKDGTPVNSSLTGRELLDRIKFGVYGEENKHSLIFMRTARTESWLKKDCLQNGAIGYFGVGGYDDELIEEIKKRINVDDWTVE